MIWEFYIGLSIIMAKAQKYEDVYNRLVEFFSHYSPSLDRVAIMATINSLVKSAFPSLIFVGFYIIREVEGELRLEVLACARIYMGKGVCGTSAMERRLLRVPDVTEFEGYIACDSETKSELVIPVFKGDDVIAVLDVDAVEVNYFDETDEIWLAKILEFLRNSN
jgi:GAF domain-containing protein